MFRKPSAMLVTIAVATALSQSQAFGQDSTPAASGELEQVIVNLGVNAADAMIAQPVGRLRIATATRRLDDEARLLGLTPGEYVEITVADSGCGMDAECRKRAFEPFFTTKPLGRGTGLGLSTVHGIVGQSGGTVSVETAPARGSRFVVRLPLSPEVLPEPSTAATLVD